jgi:uncharacterized DUF497 family protein
MDYEWDERKRAINLTKHGIDFARACRIWEENDRVLVIEDARRDYQERRFQAFGMVDGMLLMAAYTWRGRRCRIISARRASKSETAAYRARLGGGGTNEG